MRVPHRKAYRDTEADKHKPLPYQGVRTAERLSVGRGMPAESVSIKIPHVVFAFC